MNIINIVPGFGGTFYCGNCLRDSGFVMALRKTGHDAHTLPIYLPLKMNDENFEEGVPVFYGAVAIYMKQNFKLFRNMPLWLEKLFNSAPMLRYAAKKAGSTRAEGLEGMTISMLQGYDGFQKEELNQLIDYLKHHGKPDVIHLSNALLLGLAAKIKEELNVPVVCSLQDEDVWIDAMGENYRQGLWDLMSEKGKDVDSFIAVSDYFAGVMKEKMRIPDEKMHVVPIGVSPEKYTHHEPNLDNPTLGYLSRLNKENGFELFIDAFILLKQKNGFEKVRLKASGGSTGDDARFIKKQKKKLAKAGVLEQAQFTDEYEGETKLSFFNDLTLQSVPVLNGEAFGLYQLEALASGVPIVQPDLGAFPEVVKKTQGGAIYSPNTPEALADKWAEVLSNPKQIKVWSENGHQAIKTIYGMDELTKQMVSVYESVVKNKE